MKVRALGRDWEWPDDDVKCRAVVFDWSKDLAQVYPQCRQFRTAVQAGGNMGVWPWLLAKRFQRVYTAEPEPSCLAALRQNVTEKNVVILPRAFGDKPGFASIQYVAGNLGAQNLAGDSGDVEVVTIDSLGIDDCDLIYLDIEGYEMKALQGARETIAEQHPVIAVEDKGLLGTRKGDIEKWLMAEFGYRVVARPHRDVVLA